MDYRADSGWRLEPLGGESGQAYLGTRGQERVFIKRNASPMVAALSKEGITPKLLWTKRAANGDVLTAQEWIDAQTLQAHEMLDEGVIAIIQYVHQSKKLKSMLQKTQGETYQPMDFIHDYQRQLQRDLQTHQFLTEVLNYLLRTIDLVQSDEYAVCHGDINHQNFLSTADGRLFLIDWENVRLADPISDLAAVLCQYVPVTAWADWLEGLGYALDTTTQHRVEWFCLVHCMQMVKKTHFSGAYHEMNRNILLIKQLYAQRLFAD